MFRGEKEEKTAQNRTKNERCAEWPVSIQPNNSEVYFVQR